MQQAHACRAAATGFSGLWPALGLVLCLLVASPSARADIWGFMDDKGLAHFAAEQLDARYSIFSRGGERVDLQSGFKSRLEPLPDVARPVALSEAALKIAAYFESSAPYKGVKHHLSEAASAHQIELALLQALILTESGFNASAVSPKGAIGLMQIMPSTAARYGISGDKKTPIHQKLFDPRTNIKTGSRYLRDLINLFPGQLELTLAAYNAGEGAVLRAGNKIPNYKETQNYVKTVLQLYTLLKPPVPPVLPVIFVEPPRSPAGIRMQLQGGAANRTNMISSGSTTNPRLNFTIDPE